MNRDFISINTLEGEIKLSHKKRGYGLTVTSREFIIQKPHTNYILKLDDIISVVPADPYGRKPIRFIPDWSEASELVDVAPGSRHYRFQVQSALLHNRSGIRKLGACDFILPVTDEMLQAIARYAGMAGIG